jgi:hypothetical protein
MKTFDRIAELRPYFFLHTGDYTYPDYQIGPDYAGNYGLVAHSYRRRYREPRMREMLRSVPLDYVYDDNDYVGGTGTRGHLNLFDIVPSPRNPHRIGSAVFRSVPIPGTWRRNVIRGYSEFFPHYPLPDTSEGIYHSFRFANAEFFFVDRCSAREFPWNILFGKKGAVGYLIRRPTTACSAKNKCNGSATASNVRRRTGSSSSAACRSTGACAN